MSTYVTFTASGFQLSNPGFEAGSLSPWANYTGTASVVGTYVAGDQTVAPRTGAYMLSCFGGGGTVIFGANLAVPSSIWGAVDSGDVYISNVSAYHNPGIINATSGRNDVGHIYVSFLDSSGAVLSTVYSPGWNGLASVWTLLTAPTTQLPSGTRTVRIGGESVAEDSTHDSFFDDFSQPTLSISFISGTLHLEDGSTPLHLEDGSTPLETQQAQQAA